MEGTPIGAAGSTGPRPQPQETILQLFQELVHAHGALFLCQQDLAEKLAEMQAINAQGHGEPRMTKMTKEDDTKAYLESF